MVSSKRVYGLATPFVSVFPDPITKTRAPLFTDKNYPNGFIWIYKNGDVRTGYTFGGLDSNGDGVWILTGSGDTDVDTLTGDSGGALSPTNGNITLAGGTNITTVGSGSTITFNLNDSIFLSTSVTSSIYTSIGEMTIEPIGEGANLVLNSSGGKVSITAALSSDDAIVLEATGGSSAIQLQSGTGGLLMGSGQTVNMTVVTFGQSPYTVLGSDFLIAPDSTGGLITVTLPASPATGRKYVVIDAGGVAGANEITISGNGNQITKGSVLANNAVMNVNFSSMTLYFNGSYWNGIFV